MTTSEILIQSFTHLKGRPKADQALPLLQRIASLVKPIMRKHGWVLPVLAEFFPESSNLVGLNVNAGQKVLLRLRPAWAPDTFYDEEDIVRVMLHELTHNVHGPHDEQFYKFLSGLEDEYDALRKSGYAGEGFHSNGHRLGQGVSHDIPPQLARAKALEAAEKRRRMSQLMSGSRRLGGSQTNSNRSPRELAAEAAERRLRDEKACGVGQTAQREAAKAARDSVEDRVIDLTGDDEPEIVILDVPSSSKSQIQVNVQELHDHDHHTELPHKKRSRSATGKRSSSRQKTQKKVMTPPPSPAVYANPNRPLGNDDPWSCPRCTLINGSLALQCAACLLIRPVTSDPALGWTCQRCGEAGMPHQFWSCRQCGSVKANSVLG